MLIETKFINYKCLHMRFPGGGCGGLLSRARGAFSANPTPSNPYTLDPQPALTPRVSESLMVEGNTSCTMTRGYG